jgi:hypothetical protein
MFQRNAPSASKLHAMVAATLIVTLLLSLMPATAMAQAAAPGGTDEISNDTILEFGVWWVEDYPPAGAGGADLPATRPDALGLRDKLISTCKFSFLGTCFTQWAQQPAWTARFVYGNSVAWASDWRGASSGGSENVYIDSVDLAYFAGHGSSNGILFGAGSPAPTFLNKNQIIGAWGDRDLEWAALAACNVLDDPLSNLQDWGLAMNGVRLILGFKTVMNDVAHGVEFGQYIRDGNTMTQAWFKAADKLQSQGRVARVLAEQQAYFDDKPNNHNSATVVGWPKYYRTHTVGSEPARYISAAEIGNQMPALLVEPLSLSAKQSRLGALETAFSVVISPTENQLQSAAIHHLLENGGVVYSEDGQLEMDAKYGLFLHVDMDNLWRDQSAFSLLAASGTAMQAITEEHAKEIADSFLKQYGLLPADAQYYEVAPDTLATMDLMTDLSGASVATILSEETTNYQVIYSRIISYTPEVTLSGAAEAGTFAFSVMGPGSKLKLYVAKEVPADVSGASLYSPAALGGAVLGGMGGYRAIQTPVQAAEAGALRMVDVLPYEKVVKLFENLEPLAALDHIPLNPDELVGREIMTHTLAYWEGPIGFEQAELIPVYELTVSNVLTPNTIVTSTTYIPVAGEYMAPLARISTTVDTAQVLVPGTKVVLEAYDASKTLVELGLDPTPEDGYPLDFAMGSGGLYLYSWYINDVNESNLLGTGRTLQLLVNAGLNTEAKDDTVSASQRIILVVEDTDKLSEPKVSQAVITLDVGSSIFLPVAETN